MRADAFNSHVGHVRTEMTGTQKLMISHVCDSDKSKSKGIISDKNLSHVCSTEKIESESGIVDEISLEDSESESIHKSLNTNKEKDAIDETDHKKPLIIDNSVINEPSYFNPFKCG